MFDFRKWPLSVFFALAAVFCTIAPVCVWRPLWIWNFVLLSKQARMDIYVFGPMFAAAGWIAVVAAAIYVHHLRGLWLLTTGIIIVPLTVSFSILTIGCVQQGACP